MNTLSHCGKTIGVIFALSTEADPFVSRLTQVTETRATSVTILEGSLGDRRVACVVSGIGIKAATHAASMLIDGHRVGLLISAGFCGGVDPAIPRGALVLPTRVTRDGAPSLLLDWANESSDSDCALTRQLLFSRITNAFVACDTIKTVDRAMCTLEEKRTLAAGGAHVVDMETWAVADIAHRQGIGCISIRVVSDCAGQPLSPEVLQLGKPQSSFHRFGLAIRMITRRPRMAADLWNLWEHAVIDSRALSKAIEAACSLLPTPRTSSLPTSLGH